MAVDSRKAFCSLNNFFFVHSGELFYHKIQIISNTSLFLFHLTQTLYTYTIFYFYVCFLIKKIHFTTILTDSFVIQNQ